ncbi:lysostaphin resistance A-like protein [Nonomuraea sp. NPDC050536]|uniref:lysostaphin resistance A-like protein n=1 Tax=Nonomuraea sp. NPDC050536 TaxID=3364366 RepID=UPI0037C72E6A
MHPYGQPPHPYTPPRPPWFMPTPPGLRYDHLARNAARQPWQPFVGTIALGIAFFVVGLVVLVAGVTVAAFAGLPRPIGDNGQFTGDPVYSMVILLLSIAAVLPLVFGAAALIQRRRPGTLSSVAGRLRWSWLAQCMAVAVVALALGQGAQYLALSAAGLKTSDMFGWSGWGAFLPALIAIVVLVPFQAATEEYLFRGWFIQAFGTYVRNPAWSIVLGAALFASLHGYTWAGLLDVFSFGVLMGWLAVRTGGLEAPIAMHVTNNMLAFGLSAAAGDLNKALQQGEVPWQSLAGTVVQLGVFAVGVLYLAKKRAISTVSG